MVNKKSLQWSLCSYLQLWRNNNIWRISDIWMLFINKNFNHEIFQASTTSLQSDYRYQLLEVKYINIIRIDDWPSNQFFYIIIDQWIQSWFFPGNTGLNVCGGPGTDYSSSQYNNFSHHTLNSIIVELYADCDITNFWGLTDFRITLYECYLGCQFCLDSTSDCLLWKLWKSYFDLQNLDNGLEGWIKNNRFGQFTYSTNDFQYKMIILNKWDSAITYLTLPDHIALIIQFRIEYHSVLPITVSVYINDKYRYGLISSIRQVDYRTYKIDDNNNYIKLEIYSVDGQVSISELQIILQGPIDLISCFDNNLAPFDGCFAKQVSCVDGCNFCVNGECLMCDIRWDFNVDNKNCEPHCGDQLITANEQCDDGNEIPYDGCHKCYFSCPLQCRNCLFGKCQACASGYYYSNGICIINYYNFLIDNLNEVHVDFKDLLDYQQEIDVAVCGDGQVQQNEECDDGNNFPNDGCYNCNFQSILNCLLCQFGVCQICQPNYVQINHKCLDQKAQYESVICQKSDSFLDNNLIQEYGFQSDDYNIV
ncbi:unnamed protein product [Paramecium sonneborni]|uniref:Uncharacterized protein n=1 Tax=Paramecium sonneborni TaxID=65129 RepID=A0A8S1RRW2_9CILI|nr:unnamed protein product [Paramecium sonneborni]